jgi:hypothetical protein
MSLQHTVVWMDHQEARIFGVSRGALEERTVSAPTHHIHRHPKGPTAERHHPSDAAHFFHDVAGVLSTAGEVLLVGPSTAKLHFLRHVAKHAPALEAKIIGIETVDHPTDGQLIAYARRYFNLPQGGVG